MGFWEGLWPRGGYLRTFLTTTAMAVLATTLFAGSASAETENPFRCKPGEKCVMNVMVSGVEYWFPVYEMFKQAGQQMGCETEYTGTPEYDVNKQIATFDQALAQNPAGILVHPMNSDPFIEPINRAIDQGTAVVTFAADSPLSKRVSFITSDNTREGTYAADAIAEKMGGKGEYAVLENPGQDNHDKRIAAFIARMEEKWPDMKLVGDRYFAQNRLFLHLRDTRGDAAKATVDRFTERLDAYRDVVQHWNVDEAGLDDLVAKLSLKPGIHAVHVCAEDEPATLRA